MVDHFKSKPELFQAFTEPDFQYSLQDAGRAAASNDEEQTEQLLLDLLVNRAEQGDSARVRLATSQAIKAADKLSPDTLVGITALWAVSYVSWSNPVDFVGHLAAILSVTKKLTEIGLPQSRSWLQDGDALNLLRTSLGGILTRKTYREMLHSKLESHLVPGVDSEAAADLLDQAEVIAPGFKKQLRAHPLKPGFVILPGSSKEQLVATLPAAAVSSDIVFQLADQNGYGVQDPVSIEKLEEVLSAAESIKTFSQWWDSLPVGDLTVIGDVIGFINARRYLNLNGAQTVGEFLDLRAG